MNGSTEIDVTYDFQSDARGRDPDTWSPTLARYHEILWSKPLPNGGQWKLRATPRPPIYLYDQSQEPELCLSSDTVIPTFTRESPIPTTIEQIPDEDKQSFFALAYTIGGMMVFPAVQVDRKMTINAQRGCHPRIRDRFDLTIECIRRHYLGETSPLAATLARYPDFFQLFRDFRGYVEFFLLQDLVTPDCSEVQLFLPLDGFRVAPLPRNVSEYVSYRQRAMAFIEARNHRISEWCRGMGQ